MDETTAKMCRICLNVIAENAQIHIIDNYSDLMLESKLLEFVPEIDLSLTPNPICCQTCMNIIQQMHEFKQMCLQTETVIKNSGVALKVEDVKDIIKEEYLDIDDELPLNVVDDQFTTVVKEEPSCIYYCYNCDYNADTKRSLINHVRVHRNVPADFKEYESEKPFKWEIFHDQFIKEAFHYCYNCNYCTDDKKRLLKHLQIHMRKRQKFHCDQCNFSCNRADNLKTHFLTHSVVKSLKCYSCNFSTNYKYYLKKHMSVHMNVKPVKCSQCNYSSHQTDLLKSHLLIHNSEKLFKCSTCNYRTNYKHRIKAHFRIHTNEKLFKCNQCSYTSVHTSCIRNHSVVHNGEKPFKCDLCNYSTKYRHRLRTHSSTHTKEKSFKCNQCSYSCNRADNLKTHVLTHDNVKTLKCHKCSYSTNQKHYLKKHLDRHNKRDYSTF